MFKPVILCCVLAVFGGYLIQYLADAGLFRKIEPHGIDRCHLLVPSDGEGQAFEDFAIDYEQGIVYAPGDDRRWWFPFNQSIDGLEKQGHVYRFDIEQETFQRFQLIDYPYEHFHPLGISHLKGKETQLFVTNFRQHDGQVLGTVEIFRVDSSNGNRLQWIESVVHPLFRTPDDLLVIDEKTFFVTNVYYYRKDHSAFLHSVEVLTRRPWTNLLLCSKTDQWSCTPVIEHICLANGLAASLDFRTIYMAASIEKRIYVFQHDPDTHALTFQNFLYVPFAIDNIVVNDRDQLIAAGHPNVFTYLKYERNPRERRSYSEVILFSDPKSNSTYQTPLLSRGEMLSASTVAVTFKDKLLVGALLDHGILSCQGLF